MLVSKEQLRKHLMDKMTNQDIATIYGTTFQKIIQLIKRYNLNSNELRKVNHFVVYEHGLDGKVVYVGSGLWYRCSRSTNRRNSEHRILMEKGKIEYKIVAEYEREEQARKHERELIKKYKAVGQSIFNKQVN